MLLMINTSMKKLTKKSSISARWMIFFGLLPPTAQVQCGKNGGFDVFLFGYIYLYILLLRYIVIYLEL